MERIRIRFLDETDPDMVLRLDVSGSVSSKNRIRIRFLNGTDPDSVLRWDEFGIGLNDRINIWLKIIKINVFIQELQIVQVDR